MSDRLTTFSHAGFAFDVVDSGPLDGEPVVLLHGFPQRASSWAPVSALLHESGLRTYALDQRGYSPGARPRSRFAYGIKELRSDVLALVAAIGRGPVHLVGHDWGAGVAWSVAGHAPHAVRSLTALSVPHPAAFTRSMVTSTQALHSTYMLAFQLPVVPELVLSRFPDKLLRGFGMSREMVATYKADMLDGALRGGLGYYRSLVRADGFDTPVEVPTTYVWSDHDAALGRRGAETTGRWVNGPYDFVVLEGASHWLLEERTAEVAAAIAKRAASA